MDYITVMKKRHTLSIISSQLLQHYCFTSVIWGRKFLCTGSSLRSSKALLFWAGVFENLDIKKASGPDGLYNCLWWMKGTHSQSFLSQLFQHHCFTSVIWGRKFLCLCTGSSHMSSKALLFWAGVFENLNIKKASGPDGISARVHKETAISSITPCSKKALY